MISTRYIPTRCAASRLLVWTLLLALGFYGYSGAVLQLLGPKHTHSVEDVALLAPHSAVRAVSLVQRAREWLRPVRQWHAEMHARSHAAGTAGHAHHHDASERHHHDIGDESVISLDGAGLTADAVADAAVTVSAVSAHMPLGLCAGLMLPEAAALPRLWPRPQPPSWRDALTKLPERPPRA